MLASQARILKKTLLGSLVFVGLLSEPLRSEPIVDIDQQVPLGTVVVDKTKEYALFSLGNARAIRFSLAKIKEKKGAELKNLLFEATARAMKGRIVKRRNLKW